MNVFGRLEDVEPRRLADGVLTRILAGQRMTLVVVELDAGRPMPQHAHDNEQIGFMLSGSIAFRVDGEMRVLEAGDSWVVPPGLFHGIDETGPDGATLVEAFAPARRDWEDLERVPSRPLQRALEAAPAPRLR